MPLSSLPANLLKRGENWDPIFEQVPWWMLGQCLSVAILVALPGVVVLVWNRFVPGSPRFSAVSVSLFTMVALLSLFRIWSDPHFRSWSTLHVRDDVVLRYGFYAWRVFVIFVGALLGTHHAVVATITEDAPPGNDSRSESSEPAA